MRLAVVVALAALAASPAAPALTVSISCGAVGRELALCRAGAREWARRTGNEVRVISAPSASDERLALYQQLLAAHSGDVDVFQIDVIWPGILAQHLVDLRPYAGRAVHEHFASEIANDTVGGRLVALPWFTSTGLLYYRRDLLARYHARVPETWAELAATARRIQDAERARGDAGMWGFVWQGRAYEGLTCDALEWIASRGGGTIVDAKGRVTVSNPRAAAALAAAAAWVNTISPPGVLNYAEEEARGVFQSGHAVFMRNWPYAWALAQAPDSPVRGRVGVAVLPRGGADGAHVAALGGWQLAVSRYSAHPRVAASLVEWLTSRAEQKRRALAAGYAPTRPALYRDPETLRADPLLNTLSATLEGAVARPASVAGTRYGRVSARFWTTVHAVLAGRTRAAPALARLARSLARILRGARR